MVMRQCIGNGYACVHVCCVWVWLQVDLALVSVYVHTCGVCTCGVCMYVCRCVGVGMGLTCRLIWHSCSCPHMTISNQGGIIDSHTAFFRPRPSARFWYAWARGRVGVRACGRLGSVRASVCGTCARARSMTRSVGVCLCMCGRVCACACVRVTWCNQGY